MGSRCLQNEPHPSPPSRASRALSLDQPTAQHEKLLCQTWCQQVRQRGAAPGLCLLLGNTACWGIPSLGTPSRALSAFILCLPPLPFRSLLSPPKLWGKRQDGT